MSKIPSTFPKLIYLNGPAGVGKTLLADKLISLDDRAIIQHYFISPLWTALDVFAPSSSPTDNPLDFTKQTTLDARLLSTSPLTWRDALHDLEAFTTKFFGNEYLAEAATTNASDLLTIHGYETVIIPDIRSLTDIVDLSTLVSKRDQLLIRIERSGYSFENETGAYLFPDIPSVTFNNDTTEDEFLNSVVDYLTKD